MRHQDSHGAWSGWSVETPFTTAANQPPAQPSNQSPSDGITDVSLTLTLQSSAFSDLDAGDTHAASQWQITAASGDYSSPVFDSGTDTSNLTQINIPSLSHSTTYHWHMRHQDNHGAWSVWSAETSFTTGSAVYVGPGETYTTIQAAVNAANPGDSIIVRDGIYTENVDVNKPLTIRPKNGFGVTTVQAANSDDHVFEISAGNVTITDFTIIGATGSNKAGIYLGNGVDHCNLSNNRCGYDSEHKNFYGIRSHQASENTMSNNIASSNSFGIYLSYSANNNAISNNTLLNNGRGIHSNSSSYNTISGNNASNNEYGISLQSSSNYNIVSGNTANSNSNTGIYVGGSTNNIIFNNTANSNSSFNGIHLSGSTQNTISDNTANSNGYDGILLSGSSNNNTISNNTASNNSIYGIRVWDSSNNTITNNTVEGNNNCGIYMTNSSNNTIYLNNVTNNTNVWSNSTNTWHSPTISYTYNGETYTNYLGNYWSDYGGADADGDGIGDTAYTISGDANDDDYPLMETSDNYIL